MTEPPRSLERFQEVWTGILRTVPESRAIWLLSFELMFQDERLEEVRTLLAEAQRQGRAGLAAMFTGIPEADLDEETVETEGRLYQTLLNGLMVQWLFDPDSATTAEQLTEGLRRTVRGDRARLNRVRPVTGARRPLRFRARQCPALRGALTGAVAAGR